MSPVSPRYATAPGGHFLMATITSPYRTTKLADSDRRVRHPLQRLRGTIRFYALAEAISVLVVCLAVWFWLGLLLDYGTFRLSGLDWVEHVTLWLRAVGLGAVLLGIVGLIELRLHRRMFRKPKETVETVSGMPMVPGLVPSMLVTNYVPEHRSRKKQRSWLLGTLGIFLWLTVGLAYTIVAVVMSALFWAAVILFPTAVLATVLYVSVRYLARHESTWAEVLTDLGSGAVVFLTSLAALFLLGTQVFAVVLLLGFTAGVLRVAFNLRWWAVGVVMVLLGIYFAVWAAFGWLLQSQVPQGMGIPNWVIAGGLVALILGGLSIFMVAKRLLYDFSDPALALVLERRFPDLLGDRLITAVELADVCSAAKLGYSP